MNDTAQQYLSQQEFLIQITDVYSKFSKVDLDGRKRILQILIQEIQKEKDRELIAFFYDIKTIFFEKHKKLAVAYVREKYQIKGRPTPKDFYRICKGENITVVNSLPAPEMQPLKQYGCFFIVPENRYFISFDENLKNKERLLCQFQMLGNYFLHRGELPSVDEAFAETETNDRQEYEAKVFAMYFIDVKPMEAR